MALATRLQLATVNTKVHVSNLVYFAKESSVGVDYLHLMCVVFSQSEVFGSKPIYERPSWVQT